MQRECATVIGIEFNPTWAHVFDARDASLARKSGASAAPRSGECTPASYATQAGAGWEVQILDEAGEILVSRHCVNEREARYVAEAAKKDQLRTGSIAVEKGGKSKGP